MRYELLYEISRPIIEAVGVENVLGAIVESSAKGTGAKGCSLLTLTADGKHLIHRVTYGLSKGYLSKGKMSVKGMEQVFAGKPIAVYDVSREGGVEYTAEAAAEGIVSMLSLPLRVKKEVVGVLRLYFDEPRKFRKGEVDFLESIAELSGIVLEKAEQYENVSRDAEGAHKEVVKLAEEKERFIRFLSMVAHDLKAPLAAVESYLKVMLRGSVGELNNKQMQWINRSILRLDNMLELISDLLDVSRIETGETASEFQMVSWKAVLDNCLEMARSLAEPKGIRVRAKIDPDLPEMFASEVRLCQMINNLTSNACRYTPVDGRILVRAQATEDDVEISVEDDGTGIKPEIMPRIFEDFFKGDPDHPEGTGLGLSICKRIVEMHQGTIQAESPVPGKSYGTRFTCKIPLRVPGRAG
jgi:signal transduction histidine kinase